MMANSTTDRTSGDSFNNNVADSENDVVESRGCDKETWLEWLRITSDCANLKTNSKQQEHIRDLVRKGVPNNLRAKIWKLLANAQQVTPESSEQYRKMLLEMSDCEKLIQRDIARTYPEVDYFKEEAGPGQEGLFNVIKAYSLHDKEVGYCQGSAFIVGLLLLHLSEEESFILLCKIMQDYRMREIYKPTMAELGLCIYQLECLVQELLPELYVHFQSQNFYTSMYSSPWFCTLFASYLPLHLAYRVMDLFLSEGLDMIFRLSVAILQLCKEDLLKLDMEGLLKYFQKEMPSRIDCAPDHLINCACQIKFDSKKMKKLCKDYTTIKNKEQEEAIEFRRLRTENRLLQDKLKVLETESKELAGKLIQGQVSRAQQAEDEFVIKRELCQLRNSDEEHRKTIKRLEDKITELEMKLADRNMRFSNEADLVIAALQEELVAVKLREAENHVEIQQLNSKITEQELYIKSLRENVPEDPIAQLQEELSAAKLREAESSFALKELKSKFNELQVMWHDHLQQVRGIGTSGNSESQPGSLDQSTNNNTTNNSNSSPVASNSSSMISTGSMTQQQQASSSLNNSTSSNPSAASASAQPSSLTSLSLSSSSALSKLFNSSVIKRATSGGSSSTVQSSGNNGGQNSGNLNEEIERVKQEIMTIKLQEATSLAEIKTLRSREMELETLIKIQENKYKRKLDEFTRIELELNDERVKLAEVTEQLKQEQHKLTDMVWQRKEEQIMKRMQDIEQTTLIGQLRQRISSLESKLEEIAAGRKLEESGTEPKDAQDYQRRVAELQSESFRLDASSRKLQDLERRNSERKQQVDDSDELYKTTETSTKAIQDVKAVQVAMADVNCSGQPKLEPA